MTKEEALSKYCETIAIADPLLLGKFQRLAFEQTWDAAFEEGRVKGNQDAIESRVTKMIDAQKNVSLESRCPYVQYGYRFIAHPDGTLTVTPTGANKK